MGGFCKWLGVGETKVYLSSWYSYIMSESVSQITVLHCHITININRKKYLFYRI